MAHILVVDDDPIVCDTLLDMLTVLHHDARAVTSGQEGLRAYRQAPADAVLLDVYMPGLDGMEFTLRLLSEAPEALIIAMTGGGWKDLETTLAEMEQLGAVATIAKPITLEKLKNALDRALQRAVPSDEG